MLDHWLTSELGEDARIFFDADDIEAGQSWPQRLADGVASSKVMVCLWSREYFRSEWCAQELSHMLARRASTAGSGMPLPLVIGVVIHDGEDIPHGVADIQRFPIQKYASPWIQQRSPNAERLSEQIRELASSVGKACASAPDHDPEWRRLATAQFRSLFEPRHPAAGRPTLGEAG